MSTKSDDSLGIDYAVLSDVDTSSAQNVPLSHSPAHAIEKKYTVVNFSDNDIVVQNRDGIPMRIHPQYRPPGVNRPGILIRLTYNLGNRVEMMAYNVVNAPTSDEFSDIKALQEAIQHRIKSPRTGNEVIEVDYFIPSFKIKQVGGLFYVKQVDMLISNRPNNDIGVHPYSRLADHLDAKRGDVFNDQYAGFYYRLRLIDNENKYGTHYVNINGEVYTVHPIRDPNLKSGIQFFTPANALQDLDVGAEPHWDYYTIEEGIERFNLYKTRADALTHGNDKEAFEMELKDKRRELREKDLELDRLKQERSAEYAQMKQELEQAVLQQKTDYEKESLDAKRRYERELEDRQIRLDRLREDREYYKDMLDKRQMDRKDHYDQRSTVRKDTSELIKAVPVILTAAATAIGFFVGGRMR